VHIFSVDVKVGYEGLGGCEKCCIAVSHPAGIFFLDKSFEFAVCSSANLKAYFLEFTKLGCPADFLNKRLFRTKVLVVGHYQGGSV
jgi:hypothetical protein